MSPFKILAASLVIAGGATLCSPLAYAADALLVTPAAGVPLEAQGTITIQVDAGVSNDRYANFFVQLDGDDITGLVSVNGRTVSYQPPVRLALGDHILVLVEKIAENHFTELARWTLKVGGEGLAGAALTGQFAGQYNYLVSDNLEQNDKVSPHSGTATLNAAGSVLNRGWQTDAKINGFFDSKETNNAPDDDHFMLGEYLVTTRNTSGPLGTTLNFGNHDAGLSNLLVDQYYRRGLSARFDINSWLRVTGFAQDPARAIGNGNVTGLARDDQRAEGGALRVFPLSDTYGERVFVEGAGYYGQGTISGDGAGIPTTFSNEGRGWTAAVEGQTLDDKVNAHADFAETHFDDDGAGLIVQEKTDSAYRARVAWSPIATLLKTDTSTERMQILAQYHRFGTFYRSLANLGTPVDEQRASLTASYLKDSLSLTGETYGAENNTGDDPLLPTDRGAGALVQATVQPVFFFKDVAAESFLGRTTWIAGASYSREKRHETPLLFLGDGLDQSTVTFNGGWTVAYEKATATFSHTFTDFVNDAVANDSYQTNFTELSLTWMVADWLTVTPAAQMQIQHDHGPLSGTTEQYFAALDTSAVLIPDKLTHTFHYGGIFDHGTAADDQNNASTEFVWQLKQAGLNDPGIALSLSGNYEHATRDGVPPLSDKDENYKVFLSLKVGAAFGL